MGHYDVREIITIGVGMDISIVDLTGLVMQAIGYKGEIVCDLKRPDATPHTLVDVPKISKPGWETVFHGWMGCGGTYQ